MDGYPPGCWVQRLCTTHTPTPTEDAITAPAYTPPARTLQGLPAAQECSLCRTPWYDGHPADCTAQVFTEERLAQALAEHLAPHLAHAYAQGAQDALARLKSSLPAEYADLVDGLVADYAQ